MPRYPDPATRTVLEPNCDRCPALVKSRACISWGNGPPDADVVVVGEAPGAGDSDADPWAGGNHTGLAYTSQHSGRRIRDLFASLGLADRTYYTNAVKCFPSDEEGSNREPTADERTACRAHLEAELTSRDPTVVVPTGKHATQTLFAVEDRSLESFLDTVLVPQSCPTLGVTLVPLLHPSYQEVWLARLGYDEAEYRETLRDVLERAGVTG